MLPEYARLTVKVLEVSLERGKFDFKADGCTVRLSLGHQRYRHTIHTFPSDTEYTFSATLHAHLFYILQADCYAIRRHSTTTKRILSRMANVTGKREHVGRAQLRVRLLGEAADSGDGEGMVGWWELRPKADCFLPLDELGTLPDDPRSNNAIGTIKLLLAWRKVHGVATVDGNSPIAPVMAVEAVKRVAQAEAVVRGGEPLFPNAGGCCDTVLASGDDALSNSDRTGSPVDVLQFQGTEDIERAVADVSISKPTAPSSALDPNSPNNTNHTIDTNQHKLPQSSTTAMFQRMASAFMNEEDYKALLTIQALVLAFNQGIEVGGVAMTRSFILLQRYFRTRPQSANGLTENTCMSKRDFGLPRSLFRFVIASFGWLGVTYVGRGKGLIDGMRQSADAKTIREFLRISEQDLLHCNFDAPGAFRPVFFVARDRHLQALVVSIRGTMHANDALTDLVCDYVEWRGGHVHSGIMAAAQWVLRQIEPMLVECLEGDVDGDHDGASRNTRKLPNLYLCGHSLGGGTAILLTMLLSEDVRFKGVNIRCAAFGPPPVVSPNLCAQPHIDVFVNGDDGVPRLCYGSAVDLQSLMLYCAHVSTDSWLFGDINARLCHNLDTCRRIIAARSLSIKLLHPGRVHFLAAVDGSTKVFKVPADFFNELRVTKRILFDHLPDQYERAMDSAYVGYLMRELEGRRVNGGGRLQIDLAGDQRRSGTPSPPSSPGKSRSNSV